MRIKVLFFAYLKRAAGLESCTLEVADGANARDAARLVEEKYSLSLKGCMVAINDEYTTPESIIKDGDEIAFLPPVAGGSSDTWAELTECELKLDAAASYLVRPEYGAQAYFVGTVRSPNAGKAVQWIDYEGYEALALKIIKAAAEEARLKHGELRVYIQHRVGRLLPAEASILIGVASPHRRAALEACEQIIEYLKVHIPVWKHEYTEDGEVWVDGKSAYETL